MRYAPLTLTTLASLIPPEIPAEVTLLDEGVDEIDAAKIDADLVGITAITGTAPRAYELAHEFRTRNIPVVPGNRTWRRASQEGSGRGMPGWQHSIRGMDGRRSFRGGSWRVTLGCTTPISNRRP